MSTHDVNTDQVIGDKKYEVRYWDKNGYYVSEFTDSWLKFMKLRKTNKVIYYKVKQGGN